MHLAILTAFGLAPADRASPPAVKPPEPARPLEEPRPLRRVHLAGPGRAVASGRSAEDIPGFPVPVAAQGAQEGRAVMLPALAPEQVRNAADGDRASRRKTPAPVPIPRPDLAQDEPQLARGAKGERDWQLPGSRVRPLQIFPSPLPGQAPGQTVAKRPPPSGGSPRDVKLAMRGYEAAPSSAARAAEPPAPGQHTPMVQAKPPALPPAAPPPALRTSGQSSTPAPVGGGGIPGLAPTSPEAPSPGAATRGAGDGVPAGAAPRGGDPGQEETRPAQARPEPHEERVEQTELESTASAQPPERAPEDQAPPANNDLDERRRFSVSVPADVEVEAPQGAFSPRSSDEERLAGPEREPSPSSERAAAVRARAPAPVGPEDITAMRRMDEPRPGEPAPRYRERAELTADPLSTGPTEGARLTGLPGAASKPGADPLARQGDTGSTAERALQDPNAPFGGRVPSPDAPPAPDSAPVPVPPEAMAKQAARAEARRPTLEPDAIGKVETHVEVVPPEALAELNAAPNADAAQTEARRQPPDPGEAPAELDAAQTTAQRPDEATAELDSNARAAAVRTETRQRPPDPAREAPAEHATQPAAVDAKTQRSPPDPTTSDAPPSPSVARIGDEPSPPDSKDLPTAAEAPRSDQRGPHVPRPEPSPEDRPALEGIPGGAETPQPVLLAMAPPTTHSGLEGASTRLELPGDDSLDSARRALASANELLELAALEGGEVGARKAAEAATALAAAEEKLRGLQAPSTSEAGATPQAGALTDLPQGGGVGSAAGSPRLGGSGRLNALAQGRVDYVISLVGPSAIRRAGRGGTGRVDFRVDELGYVREVAIRKSTGTNVLDREIEAALHLAEPYAATSGWISVVVRFEAH
ncbi:MAG TPA: TonB family protein [Myxococcaceae bacterium]